MSAVSGTLIRPPTPPTDDELFVVLPDHDDNPLGLIEYVLPLEPFRLYPNYFSFAPKIQSECIRFSLKGRELSVYGMKEEVRDKEFENAFEGLIEPVFKNDELKAAADAFIQEHAELTHLADKWKSAKNYLKGEYTTLDFFYFLLGEELCKRIQPSLCSYWCIKAVNVPRLKELIGFFLALAEQDHLEDSIIFAKGLLKQFEQDKDYLLEDDFLPRLLPVVKKPLSPWPRLETVKQEIRRYFLYDNLLRNVTSEMHQLLDHFVRTMAPEVRDRIGAELLAAQSDKDKVKVAKAFEIRTWNFRGEEEETFLDFLADMLPSENNLLMQPIETIESSVPEELLEYVETLTKPDKPYKSPGKQVLDEVLDVFIPLVEKLLKHISKEELSEFLSDVDADPKTPIPFEFPDDLKQELEQFLTLFKKHRFTRLIMDEDDPISVIEMRSNHLFELERSARSTLEKVCSAAELVIVFRQGGKDVSLGSIPSKRSAEEYLCILQGDEDDETVFVFK